MDQWRFDRLASLYAKRSRKNYNKANNCLTTVPW
jgi:hypothetical protein